MLRALLCLTIGENTIGSPKIQNNYGSIYLFIFSIAPRKVIALNLFCFIFVISSLSLFFITLSKVNALPTIAIAIVVALRSEREKSFINFGYRL